MRAIFALSLGLAFCSSVMAQQAAKSDLLFHRMAGKWELHGTLGGKETTHDVDAALVLKDGYLQLHEISREKDASGVPKYEAIILISIDKPTGDFTCLWLDSTESIGLSGAAIARGTPSGNAIPFVFGSGADIIRNTFTYFPDRDAWTWAIDNESNGKVKPFARLTLTRR